MSRRGKRPAPPTRNYPKLKLSPAKDAFSTTNLGTTTTASIHGQKVGVINRYPTANQQSPPPPITTSPTTSQMPPTSIPNSGSGAISSQSFKRPRFDDGSSNYPSSHHHQPPALKLTFTTTPTPTQTRFAPAYRSTNPATASASNYQTTAAATSTIAEPAAASSTNSSLNGTNTNSVASSSQRARDPIYDTLANDPDLLQDIEWPDEEELLRPLIAVNRRKSNRPPPHVSRMTLQLTSTTHTMATSTGSSISGSQLAPTVAPIPTSLIPPSISPLDEIEQKEVMREMNDTVQPMDMDDAPSALDSTKANVITSESRLNPDPAAGDSKSLPSSANTSPTTSPSISPSPMMPISSTFLMVKKPARPISSQIQLSAVTEGEEEALSQESMRLPPSQTGPEERIQMTPLPTEQKEEKPVMNDQPPIIPSSAHDHPSQSSTTATAGGDLLAPVANSQPTSSQPVSSQQSTSLPYWPDEYPSLSYLYSDFPDPIISIEAEEEDEQAFQQLARDAPTEDEMGVDGEVGDMSGGSGSGGAPGSEHHQRSHPNRLVRLYPRRPVPASIMFSQSSDQATQVLSASAKISPTPHLSGGGSPVLSCSSNANTQILPGSNRSPRSKPGTPASTNRSAPLETQ